MQKKPLKDVLQVCDICGQTYSMRGMPRHRQKCARDHTAPPAEPAPPTKPAEILPALSAISVPQLPQGSEIITTATGNQIEIVRSVAAPAAKPAKIAALSEMSSGDIKDILQTPGVSEFLQTANRLGNAIAGRIENGTAGKQNTAQNKPTQADF